MNRFGNEIYSPQQDHLPEIFYIVTFTDVKMRSDVLLFVNLI